MDTDIIFWQICACEYWGPTAGTVGQVHESAAHHNYGISKWVWKVGKRGCVFVHTRLTVRVDSG